VGPVKAKIRPHPIPGHAAIVSSILKKDQPPMIRKFLLLLIRGYKKGISPLLGNNCRFYPTCSAYTYEAIETHRVFRGIFLGIKRILKCQPFHPGGYDPVPGSPAIPPETPLPDIEKTVEVK
jgi:putative membrane protein insertion efficiency factor